ncbi:MAG: hypothetical protein QMC77_07160, partial [Methanocellales archaeon]|nr:hypothetical protein [Methanocellales archaeon]
MKAREVKRLWIGGNIPPSKLNYSTQHWALAIAYNAMLQAGRALIFSEGYRPIGRYEHVGVMR